jgi:predicted component of viral defense system (DUF524 family)
MGSAPTSRLGFRRRDGAILSAPEEWTTGFVEVRVSPEQWANVTVLRQGTPLQLSLRKLAGEALVLAEWPRSGAGHYGLEYVGPDERETVVWTVQPKKLTPSAYGCLLAELDDLPVSIAISLQRLGALAQLKLLAPGETTIAQELVRIRRAIRGTDNRRGLASVLHALSTNPYSVLETRSLWVPLERARRVPPSELPRAYMRGHNISVDRVPERVPDSRVEHTVDVYENRLLRSFHDEVERRLRRLQTRLNAATNEEAVVEAAKLREDLRRARLEASFLDDVGLPRHLPTRLTMVLLRRPEYRAALEGFLEFRRSTSVRIEEPALEAPLTQLPQLYETWGVLRVIDAVARVAATLGYRLELERLLYRDASGVFVQLLRDNRPALVLRHDGASQTVRVIPQRSYQPRRAGLRSASYEQRPDVAIEIEHDDGGVRVVIFDPKYKLDSEEVEGEIIDARPKKIDVDKMHAYRDAIRDGDQRVVTYAALLYPGPAIEPFGVGVDAISAVPGSALTLETRLLGVLETSLAAPDAAQPAA